MTTAPRRSASVGARLGAATAGRLRAVDDVLDDAPPPPSRPATRSPSATVLRRIVQRSEDLLRRLSFNDENAVRLVLQDVPAVCGPSPLDAKTHALVRLGALLSLGAATDS